MAGRVRILGFGGSLRKGSCTRSLLSAAAELLPGDAELEIFDIAGIPMFNQDLESDPPQEVSRFKDAIRAADAILISTPEYNYSVPGFLKNAIDWASRPPSDNPFDDKPVAIIGGGGALAGSRAQYHLRQIMASLNARLVNRPEVMVPFIREKVDQQGRLVDEATRKRVAELLAALIEWTVRLGK